MNIRRILQIGAKIQQYHDIYNTQMDLFDLIIFIWEARVISISQTLSQPFLATRKAARPSSGIETLMRK